MAMVTEGEAALADEKPGGTKPTPPKWLRSKKLYEGEPLTLEEIAEIEGITTQALHLRRQACGWTPRRPGRGGQGTPPTEAASAKERALHGGRPAILRRLWELLERQVGDLAGAAATGGTAQELASLTRTLEKLIETERDLGDGGGAADEGPEDIDGFRDEIARRLEGLLAAGTDG